MLAGNVEVVDPMGDVVRELLAVHRTYGRCDAEHERVRARHVCTQCHRLVEAHVSRNGVEIAAMGGHAEDPERLPSRKETSAQSHIEAHGVASHVSGLCHEA
jgi:hypothetical protein